MADGSFSRNISGYFNKIKHRFLLTSKCDKGSFHFIFYHIFYHIIEIEMEKRHILSHKSNVCKEEKNASSKT